MLKVFQTLPLCTLPVFAKLSFVLLALNPLESTASPKAQYENLLKQKLSKSEKHFKDFRLVQELETFPPRPKAETELKIKSKPGGALVTLHDPKTGKPLETCKAPCTVNVRARKDYFLLTYKPGFLPQTQYVNTKRQKDNSYTLYLGRNYYALEDKYRECLNDIKLSGITDREVQNCFRLPAKMPPRAERSGDCEVGFDVSDKGVPINIEAIECTEPVFKRNSEEAVSWWRYTPKMVNGKAVKQDALTTKMNYILKNGRGKIIPAKK